MATPLLAQKAEESRRRPRACNAGSCSLVLPWSWMRAGGRTAHGQRNEEAEMARSSSLQGRRRGRHGRGQGSGRGDRAWGTAPLRACVAAAWEDERERMSGCKGEGISRGPGGLGLGGVQAGL